ncbi:MAG: SUMF1/EgtB/PvdO family nonheme iron enzyme [Spirulina sp. SIO3F2]|nr:SUMF1/EgtB/PvdO family nonheme iron enzyme [Spirulina sp. SIO3F2]
MTGKNCAIAIGINNYHNIESLHYAQRDAAAMRAYFQAELQFERVLHFAEDGDYLPTYAILRRLLRKCSELLKLEAGDNLWFFFAGHGQRYENRDYLLPIDVDPGDIEGTAISLQYVTERLTQCGSDNVILLIDACRHTEQNTGRRDGQGGVGAVRYPGVVTFYSCSPFEYSYEIRQLEQGAFTYALLAGLRRQGEGNCATVERLDRHLSVTVPELNRKYSKPVQTPKAEAAPASKYHLILLPKQANDADVNQLRVDAFRAEMQQQWQQAKELWVRVLINAPGDKDAVEAIGRIAVRLAAGSMMGSETSGVKGISEIPARSNLSQSTDSYLSEENIDFEVNGWDESDENNKAPEESEYIGNLSQEEFDKIFNEVWREKDPDYELLPYRNYETLIEEELPDISISDIVDQIVPTIQNESSEIRFDTYRLTYSYEYVKLDAKGKIVERNQGEAEYFSEDLGEGVTLEMTAIPGGSFKMGGMEYGDEQPIHEVTVQPFFLGKFAVTQAQWARVASFPKVQIELEPDPAYFKGSDCPVEQVSWEEASEFCKRLSQHTERQYHLPSEAEWEYACRAGTTPHYHFGDVISAAVANYDASETWNGSPEGEYREQTVPVKTFPANPWGLYEMHGNVGEWCADYWHDNYDDAPIDGSVWIKGRDSNRRILRGGSWFYSPRNCRSACRIDITSGNRFSWLGFRVVCSVP